MPQSNLEITEVQFPNAKILPEIVQMMEEGHTVTLRLRGFSMRPFLEDNRDKALMKKAVNPKVGDDVTLRGDGNLNIEQCKLKDVKGFVIGFYRKGRDKMDKTNGLKWTVYSFIWTRLFPIRRYLLAFYRRIWLRFFKPI